MELFDPVYIVRGEGFGADFAPKLITALIAIGLVVWDWRSQNRLDYVWVLVVGTVAWSLAELFLQIGGVRDMPERLLFGSELPLAFSVVLQGISEGAFIAVLGLFIGDRLLSESDRGVAVIVLFVLALLALVGAIRSGNEIEVAQAASRRDVLAPRSLIFLAAITAFDVWFVVKYRRFRRRTVAMFVTMLAFAAFWTWTQVFADGRWVEVGGDVAGTFTEASTTLTVFALTFDVVVEISLAYVPFFALPVVLGRITDTGMSRVTVRD